jgi:GH15 family glucan-1,4-alpha-glucosidase
VALDRLIRFHEEGVLEIDVERHRAERAAIRAEVEARGYNESLQSYVSVLDGDELDASLLVLPLYGYATADDLRMTSTVQRIRQQLGTGSLLRRYQTPDDDPRGAFGICSFWGADCLARAGDLDAASTAFEELLLRANDVGLFAEQIDPASGAALGNFPQGFTHIGLINAALSIYGGGSHVAPSGVEE